MDLGSMLHEYCFVVHDLNRFKLGRAAQDLMCRFFFAFLGVRPDPI
jgi:hypothetical protein